MNAIKYSAKRKNKIIQQLKSHDVGYIKFELEGNSPYGENGGGCSECDGEGEWQCSNCNGDGTVLLYDDADNEYSNDCGSCDGTGYIHCDYCNGNDELTYEDLECEVFRHVTEVERQLICYYEFYHDGSVNTELTFTLPIEHIDLAVKIASAFNNAMDDFENAGLHISLLPIASNGNYPDDASFDTAKIVNFTKQSIKLLPALYLLASDGYHTRDLGYRLPRVSDNKYSAIHLCTRNDDCYAVEFRVFDPCRSDLLWYEVDIISKLWRYYDTEMTVPVERNLMYFNQRYASSLLMLYGNTVNYKALIDTVRYIKPDTITMKQLKARHNLSELTLGTLQRKDNERKKQLFKEYTDYVNAIHAKLCYEVNANENNEIELAKVYQPELQKYDNATLIRWLRHVDKIDSFAEWLLKRNFTSDINYDYVC